MYSRLWVAASVRGELAIDVDESLHLVGHSCTLSFVCFAPAALHLWGECSWRDVMQEGAGHDVAALAAFAATAAAAVTEHGRASAKKASNSSGVARSARRVGLGAFLPFRRVAFVATAGHEGG